MQSIFCLSAAIFSAIVLLLGFWFIPSILKSSSDSSNYIRCSPHKFAQEDSCKAICKADCNADSEEASTTVEVLEVEDLEVKDNVAILNALLNAYYIFNGDDVNEVNVDDIPKSNQKLGVTDINLDRTLPELEADKFRIVISGAIYESVKDSLDGIYLPLKKPVEIYYDENSGTNAISLSFLHPGAAAPQTSAILFHIPMGFVKRVSSPVAGFDKLVILFEGDSVNQLLEGINSFFPNFLDTSLPLIAVTPATETSSDKTTEKTACSATKACLDECRETMKNISKDFLPSSYYMKSSRGCSPGV